MAVAGFTLIYTQPEGAAAVRSRRGGGTVYLEYWNMRTNPENQFGKKKQFRDSNKDLHVLRLVWQMNFWIQDSIDKWENKKLHMLCILYCVTCQINSSVRTMSNILLGTLILFYYYEIQLFIYFGMTSFLLSFKCTLTKNLYTTMSCLDSFIYFDSRIIFYINTKIIRKFSYIYTLGLIKFTGVTCNCVEFVW